MGFSTLIVLAGLGLGWWFYGRKPLEQSSAPDPLEKLPGDIYQLFKNKYWIDELYENSIIAFNAWWAKACDFFDAIVWNGIVHLVSYAVLGLSWVNLFFDQKGIDGGFDETCRRVTLGGKIMSHLQNGRVQSYLRAIGLALVVLVLMLIWGCHR